MIEQHVTSLEVSKRLKELGVKQESMFYWGWNPNQEPSIHPNDCGHRPETGGNDMFCSAFLASELGEFLPNWVYSKKWLNDINSYAIFTEADKEPKGYKEPAVIMSDYHEANVRGMMLIYLLEQGIIRV